MSVSPNCAAPWNELRRNPVCMLRWLGRWPPRDWPPKAIRKRAAPRAGPPHSVSVRAPTGVRGLLARRSCPTNEAVLTHHQERVLRYPQRCCEIRPLGRGSPRTGGQLLHRAGALSVCVVCGSILWAAGSCRIAGEWDTSRASSCASVAALFER